jgi:tripartite-type tricarboxylate transporter receptor subunit TctC
VLTRRRLIALSAGSALALSLSGRAAWVQMQSLDWPNRVVRFIVPFAAGGPTDVVARVVTEQLSKIWGQQAVIENRGGAGTNIGNEMVARSDPDGYTVLFATASLAVNRSLYRSLSYDPIADFAAVSLVSRFSLFMFVPNSLPTKSVMEFVAYAKAHPGKLTLASPGSGSTPHLAGELLKQMAGIEMTHVPYRGASPALNDLIPGRVDCYFGSGALLENMRSGQLRGLAVTGAKRDPVAPELPTMAEAGVPGYEVSSWHGLFVPARTPPEIVRKISVDTVAALADPMVKSKLQRAGYMSPCMRKARDEGTLNKGDCVELVRSRHSLEEPIIRRDLRKSRREVGDRWRGRLSASAR